MTSALGILIFVCLAIMVIINAQQRASRASARIARALLDDLSSEPREDELTIEVELDKVFVFKVARRISNAFPSNVTLDWRGEERGKATESAFGTVQIRDPLSFDITVSALSLIEALDLAPDADAAAHTAALCSTQVELRPKSMTARYTLPDAYDERDTEFFQRQQREAKRGAFFVRRAILSLGRRVARSDFECLSLLASCADREGIVEENAYQALCSSIVGWALDTPDREDALFRYIEQSNSLACAATFWNALAQQGRALQRVSDLRVASLMRAARGRDRDPGALLRGVFRDRIGMDVATEPLFSLIERHDALEVLLNLRMPEEGAERALLRAFGRAVREAPSGERLRYVVHLRKSERVSMWWLEVLYGALWRDDERGEAHPRGARDLHLLWKKLVDTYPERVARDPRIDDALAAAYDARETPEMIALAERVGHLASLRALDRWAREGNEQAGAARDALAARLGKDAQGGLSVANASGRGELSAAPADRSRS